MEHIDINNLPEGWRVEESKSQNRVRLYIYDSNTNCVGASCGKCGKVFFKQYFQKATLKKNGINSHCRECCKLKGREYRKANRQHILKKSKEYREGTKHSPVVYKITFWDGYIYIGQTISIKMRMSQHKFPRARRSDVLFELLTNNPEQFKQAVDNFEILKRFEHLEPIGNSLEVCQFEYESQLKALQGGERLLGQQYKDPNFRGYLIGKVGHDEANGLLNLSKELNVVEVDIDGKTKGR